MENARDSFNSALSLFSSLYEDMAPTDLPEGLSPDNQERFYLPGSVSTRPAFLPLLASPISGQPDIVSVAEFPLPSGDIFAVFLDSTGTISYRRASDGSVFSLIDITPASRMKTESAFNKIFITAFNSAESSQFSANPFVGTEIPFFYDGSLIGGVWRVTPSPPAITPSVTDEAISYAIRVSPSGLRNIGTLTVVSASESGSIVTMQLTGGIGSTVALALNSFRTGDEWLVAGVGAGYDGTFPISSCSAVGSHLIINYLAATTGLPTFGAGGTATTAYYDVNNSAGVTALPTSDQNVTISGAGVGGYNGTWPARSISQITGIFTVYINTPSFALANSGGGTWNPAGSITQGPHNIVVIFQTTYDAITGPSLPFQWTAQGGHRAIVSQIPIGPTGTKARILAFTPAFGASYYYIKPSVIPGIAGIPTLALPGTVINDNTTTQATLDFSDEQLTSAVQIDIQGNNLFQQVVLGPCMGCFYYQGRLGVLGEVNNVKNLLNMSFDGGVASMVLGVPPQWGQDGTTGGAVNVTDAFTDEFGFACKLTSAGGLQDALISQPCVQDFYGGPILVADKDYYFRCQASKDGVATAGILVADLYSPSNAQIYASVSIPLASIAGVIGTSQNWVTGKFTSATPDVLPTDLELRIYLQNVLNGQSVQIDDCLMIDGDQPVLNNQARLSYFDNEFGFDGITGTIGFQTADSFNGAFEQRGNLYFTTDKRLLVTQNNGSTEPNDWAITEFAKDCGNANPCSIDRGPGMAWWAGVHGLQFFAGDLPKKLTQELQRTWDSVNWNSIQTLFVTNDPVQRCAYVGLPTGSGTQVDTVLPVSYRSVDTAYNVPDPQHVSYSGKIVATDNCRKWTRWIRPLQCGAMIRTSITAKPQIVFGGANFGQLLKQDLVNYPPLNPDANTWNHSDYGYGEIGGYYTTCFFFNHEVEQSAQGLGLHRKLFDYLSAYMLFDGTVTVTPLVNRLGNAWAPLTQYTKTYSLAQLLNVDMEWRVNVLGDRVAYKIAAPAFMLQHLVVTAREDRLFPVRGAAL